MSIFTFQKLHLNNYFMPNILVIDDDEIMLKTIQYILNKDGFNVVTAADGKEAFELLEYSAFDVVITDIRMPRVNGMEVISKIRGNKLNKHIGIIIVSMVIDKETIADALEMGADYYLKKPIVVDELRESISRLMTARKW